MNIRINYFLTAIFASTLFVTIAPTSARADAYSCQKMIYATGWLRKYDYKGETWAAGTKKSGAISSSLHVSTENSTSSVDPGVSTGQFMSYSQYTSSWGQCAAVDYNVAQQFRDDYIQQNLHEIKKQVALGEGYHLESLAYLSGCQNPNAAAWNHALQSQTGEFYDAKDAVSFRTKLDSVIQNTPELKVACRLPTAS